MENQNQLIDHAHLDKAGAILSFTCAVHCLAFPLLIVVLPWIGMGFLLDEKVEFFFVTGSLLLATTSFCWGYRLHRNTRLLLMFGICVVMILVGKLCLQEPVGLWLSVPGALGLATGHLINRKLCQSCGDCCEHGKE